MTPYAKNIVIIIPRYCYTVHVREMYGNFQLLCAALFMNRGAMPVIFRLANKLPFRGSIPLPKSPSVVSPRVSTSIPLHRLLGFNLLLDNLLQMLDHDFQPAWGKSVYNASNRIDSAKTS